MKGSSGRHASAGIRFIDEYLRCGPPTRLTGLLLGQLDTFNRISTTFGYEASAAFCVRYAEQLRNSLQEGARVVRLSGRRFAVLLPIDSMSAVIDVAGRLTEETPPQMRAGGESWLVDVTLGIAVHPSHADDATTLFRRAELALEEAKSNELSFDVYRPETTQQHAALWKLSSDLDRAVQHGELEVYFQPKLDIGSRRVGGVEALVRWRSPSGGLVPPDNFIPLAERTGSIVPITWLVFEGVARHAAAWPPPGEPFHIAVNVAPQIFAHAEFGPRLAELKQALDARRIGLTLEITEDSLVQSEDVSAGTIARLRKLGIDLSLDDFGRGYSSLSYLKEIPAAEIKIDKRFVGTIAADPKDRQIVGTVIELAHGLDMRVVAEGVDSQESLAIVAELGCDLAQGFFIARPMRGDLLPTWLDEHSGVARLTSAAASGPPAARVPAAPGS